MRGVEQYVGNQAVAGVEQLVIANYQPVRVTVAPAIPCDRQPAAHAPLFEVVQHRGRRVDECSPEPAVGAADRNHHGLRLHVGGGITGGAHTPRGDIRIGAAQCVQQYFPLGLSARPVVERDAEEQRCGTGQVGSRAKLGEIRDA